MLVESDKFTIMRGVPQGSISGQLLFITYTNDLGQHLQECHVILYADNTALHTSDSQVERLLSLQMELSVVAEWLKATKLTQSTARTMYVMRISV